MIFFAMPPFGWLHHCDKNRLKQKNAFEKQTPKQDHFSQNRTSRKTQKSVVINSNDRYATLKAPIKGIYLYPLIKKFREALKHEA